MHTWARLLQVLEHEAAYLKALPSAAMYERSYMHRDTITHVAVARAVDFVITGWGCGTYVVLHTHHVHILHSTLCAYHATQHHTSYSPQNTGSVDGHVKFWKKQVQGIEFAKHFRAHLGPVVGMCNVCVV